MPIHKMNFEGGVFFAKQVGYIDNVDVRMWANALGNHAGEAGMPVVAVVDMREVDRLCPTVLKVFSGILKIGNLRGVALVTSDMMASRNARVIEKLAQLPSVLVFSTLDDARQYASKHTHPSFNPSLPSEFFAFGSFAGFCCT